MGEVAVSSDRESRIILFDPDSDSRRRVFDALSEAEDFSVEPTASVERLEKRLEAVEPIDCVVVGDHELDGRMAGADESDPIDDTISMVSELGRSHRTVPFVLYAESDEGVTERVVSAGVSGFVRWGKTDSSERLRIRVREAIEDAIEDDERRFGHLETMHEFALAFESCEDRESAYQLAVDAATKILDSDVTVLYVEESGQLHPVATRGELFEDRLRPYDVDEGVIGRTFETGRSSFNPHISVSDDASPLTEDIRSGISAPVGSFGVIQSISTQSGDFDDRDVQLIELLASHVSSTITRLESRQAVHDERDRFASLFETVPDAVVLTEGDSETIIEVNPGFERIFGYDGDEIIGESLDDLIVPDDREAFVVYDEIGVDGVLTTELVRETVDGPREFLFRGFATEVDNHVTEYAVYTDISDQKCRERELERYKTLIDTVGDPVYALDERGYIERVNEALVDRADRPRQELVGSHVSEFMNDEDYERGTRLLREIKAHEEREWDTFEMTFELEDGETMVVENNIAPIIDDGKLVGSVGVIRDVTDRKKRERRIRELHDGTRRLMTATDADEVATIATDIASKNLDFDLVRVYLYDADEDSLVPVTDTEETHALVGDPPVLGPGEELVWDAFDAGLPVAYGDVRTKDEVYNQDTVMRSVAHLPLGEYGILLVGSTVPNDFDEGALALANILAANVETALERAERESELADRSRELERQNDRLDEFAGTVSHDLRNPLTLAIGHVETALELADDDLEFHLEETSWALDRMNDLIEDVLVLARSGTQLTDTDLTDLHELVQKARRTVDPDLEVVVADSLPTVRADENRLLVMFENLFRNAIEHVGTDVTLTIAPTDDGFVIDDDGPGIPPEERDAVFDSGYSSEPEGTGFGLAIVKEVVEAHDWSVALEESEAGGVRFEITVGQDVNRIEQE